jgi:anti-sigma factor RsiW
MSRVDVHPEDLLDAAHRGQLDASGRERLAQHLAYCVACAAEMAAIDDFAEELAPLEGDDALLDRLVAGAMGETPTSIAESSAPAARAASGRTSRRLIWAVAASLLLGLFGGAAAAMFAMRPQRGDDVAAPTPTTPEAAAEEETPSRRGRHVAPAERPMEDPVEEPSVEEPSVEQAAGAEPPAVEEATIEETASPVATPDPRPAPRAMSAEELLALANSARRDHQYPRAIRTYRRLQAEHPRSREAAVSHVTLGRLLLDGMRQPAGALREFDRYLAQRRHRVLGEEARVGRALALQRLGRRDAERRAWNDLLQHHPDTLHAERARSRLAE